jgi:NDP-sugar pyrophosphorylase family protein
VPAPITLVVLAGGLGSRFGGPKQLEPVGPGGATLMDYAVYDAWRLGFARAVFVVREDIVDRFTREILARYRSRLDVVTAIQRLENVPSSFTVPPSRTKPWGTTHAVLAARAELAGPFAVLNADDFYGRAALAAVAGALTADATHHAVVAYRLDATSSPAGGVNRAILERHPDGTLARVVEVLDLIARSDGGFAGKRDGRPMVVAADTLVSMNLWGFRPSILPLLEEEFAAFLLAQPGDRDESYLPTAIQNAIARGRAVVDVLPAAGRWAGITYPADREWVRGFLGQQTVDGIYPKRLWD